jgi:3-hydroxyacyl-[acyl-carrier-protein] dehydratase
MTTRDPNAVGEVAGIGSVMQLLPHRYPFLLLDRVIELTPRQSIRAIKNVTINEPFFQGHFPGRPVMPGVLVIEAMAQAGGILSYMSHEDPASALVYYLAAVDGARFRRPVVPGDRLEILVDVESVRRGVWFYRAEARVDGEIAVKAQITCAPGRDA